MSIIGDSIDRRYAQVNSNTAVFPGQSACAVEPVQFRGTVIPTEVEESVVSALSKHQSTPLDYASAPLEVTDLRKTEHSRGVTADASLCGQKQQAPDRSFQYLVGDLVCLPEINAAAYLFGWVP